MIASPASNRQTKSLFAWPSTSNSPPHAVTTPSFAVSQAALPSAISTRLSTPGALQQTRRNGRTISACAKDGNARIVWRGAEPLRQMVKRNIQATGNMFVFRSPSDRTSRTYRCARFSATVCGLIRSVLTTSAGYEALLPSRRPGSHAHGRSRCGRAAKLLLLRVPAPLTMGLDRSSTVPAHVACCPPSLMLMLPRSSGIRVIPDDAVLSYPQV